MKKSLIVFVLVAALSVTALGVGGRALLDWQDDVEVTAQTLLGDAAEAEGLQISTKAHHWDYLLWETEYDTTKEPEARTTFSYFTTAQRFQAPDESSIDLNGKSADFTISGSGLAISSHNELYTKPAVDVSLRTPAGQTRTETVRLKDYYEYHAVVLSVYYSREFLENLGLLHTVIQTSDNNMTDYLRVPVEESIQLEITVTRALDGTLTEVKSRVLEEEGAAYFSLGTDGVVTADAVWFALIPRDNGKIDPTQVSLGYGLYRVPLERYNTNTLGLSTQEMKNVWPINDPETTIQSVDITDDGSRLLVVTQEADGCFMNVLSAEDCGTLSRFPIQNVQPNLIRETDGLLIMKLYDRSLQQHRILAYDIQSGQKWLDAELPVDQECDMDTPVFAFDGQRLAVADFMKYTGTSLRLLVYGSDGLRYMGYYEASTSRSLWHIDTHMEDSLVLSWQ